MKLAEEETFGPVAACFRFTSEDEVIQRANNTPYGLAAYFYTPKSGTCLPRVAGHRKRDDRN